MDVASISPGFRPIVPAMEKAPALSRLIAPYRGLGPSLWTMFLSTMVNRFGDFVGPFLSLYLSLVLGLDEIRTAGIVSLTFAASMVGSLVSGRIADTLGRKRTLLMFQLAGAAFTIGAGFLYARTWAPWLIILGNFFRGGARPLIGALLTDLAPLGRRKEVFGLQYWSINVGTALGPLAAGFLFKNALAWLFWGDAVSTILAVILVGRGVHPPAVTQAESHLEHRDERGALRAFLSRPILLAFALISLASSITYSQTSFGLSLTLKAYRGDGAAAFLAIMMSLNAVTVIALSIPTARLLRSLSPLVCMAISAVFYVLGFGAYSFPLGSLGLLLATFTWTLGEITASTNMGVFMARHTPENWRGSFQSFMGVFYSGGWAIGPLVAGPLLMAGGSGLLWKVIAGACACWGVACLWIDAWDRRILRAAGLGAEPGLDAQGKGK